MGFDLPAIDPAAEIFVASQGMSKGVRQSDGPQFIPKASLRMGILQVGAQWKNVTSTVAEGEGALFANLARKFGQTQLTGGVAYKFQTGGNEAQHTESWEFSSGLSRKFGRVSGRVNAVFSPDDLGSAKRSLYIEGGPSLDVGSGWSLSAAAGRRWRQRGVDYVSFNAGVSKSIKILQLDLRYYDTNRSGLADIYRARVVGSARLSF